jgi:hypothetical protein
MRRCVRRISVARLYAVKSNARVSLRNCSSASYFANSAGVGLVRICFREVEWILVQADWILRDGLHGFTHYWASEVGAQSSGASIEAIGARAASQYAVHRRKEKIRVIRG